LNSKWYRTVPATLTAAVMPEVPAAPWRSRTATAERPGEVHRPVTALGRGHHLAKVRFSWRPLRSPGYYLTHSAPNSVLAPPAAEALMSFYERIWSEILEERAFSMRSPTTNGPIILEAMRKGKTAMQRMANMALATEAAVKRSLSTDLRERLSKIASKRYKPEPTSED
jgi:hypothetical protein